jgi:transposase
MFKHTEQFKLQVVKQYLEGTVGFKTVAREHGVAAPMVRRWVQWYRLHGMDGLKQKGGSYDAAFKMAVLQHMWDNSFSHTQVAAVFNIRNPTTIGIWERRQREGGIEALARSSQKKSMKLPPPKSDPVSKPDDRRTREELLSELDDLRLEVLFLKKLQALVQARKPDAKKKRG